MTYAERSEQFDIRNGSNGDSQKMRSDRAILIELVKVLTPHPGGLRRWSVMRAIRKERESASRDIPQKFEDEVIIPVFSKRDGSCMGSRAGSSRSTPPSFATRALIAAARSCTTGGLPGPYGMGPRVKPGDDEGVVDASSPFRRRVWRMRRRSSPRVTKERR